MKLSYSNGGISISDEFLRGFSEKDDLIQWGKDNHPDIPNSLFSDAFDVINPNPPKVKREKKGEQ